MLDYDLVIGDFESLRGYGTARLFHLEGPGVVVRGGGCSCFREGEKFDDAIAEIEMDSPPMKILVIGDPAREIKQCDGPGKLREIADRLVLGGMTRDLLDMIIIRVEERASRKAEEETRRKIQAEFRAFWDFNVKGFPNENRAPSR